MEEETDYFISRLEFEGFEANEGTSDLELAAEIGKALLERNHELEILLKTAQDFAEDEANQALHLARQVDLLRESNENKVRLSQQLESQLHDLNDKHTKLKTEHWHLQTRNKKLNDTIEILEKKCEEYREDIENLRREEEQRLKLDSVSGTSFSYTEFQALKKDLTEFSSSESDFEESSLTSSVCNGREAELELMRDQMNTLRQSMSDVNDQFHVERKRREETESDLNEAIYENELLRLRVMELEGEIEEWQDIAHRAEQYQKLADKYCSGWDLSSEDCNYTVLAYDTKLVNVNKNNADNLLTIGGDVKHQRKAASIENLSTLKPKENGASGENLNLSGEVSGTEDATKSSCSEDLSEFHTNNVSLLSELDIQYKEMVKRYEALLEKCKQEGKIAEDPVRTKKVQRAIQTLSLDLSYITSPHSPTTKSFSKDSKCSRCSSACGFKNRVSSSSENLLDTGFDYRIMFAEIFTKLKESKDFDPAELKKLG